MGPAESASRRGFAALYRRRVWPIAVAWGVLVGLGAASIDTCDGPDVDPWVTGLRDRIMNFNALAAYAQRTHGPATACDGEVVDDFNGAKFGVVALTFGEDVTLTVQTFPPEASIVSFADASGFSDERGIRELLLAYTTDVGLRVDWSIPDVKQGDGTRVETYFDLHPGMNASVALHYSDATLTEIRVTLAL